MACSSNLRSQDRIVFCSNEINLQIFQIRFEDYDKRLLTQTDAHTLSPFFFFFFASEELPCSSTLCPLFPLLLKSTEPPILHPHSSHGDRPPLAPWGLLDQLKSFFRAFAPVLGYKVVPTTHVQKRQSQYTVFIFFHSCQISESSARHTEKDHQMHQFFVFFSLLFSTRFEDSISS